MAYFTDTMNRVEVELQCHMNDDLLETQTRFNNASMLIDQLQHGHSILVRFGETLVKCLSFIHGTH